MIQVGIPFAYGYVRLPRSRPLDPVDGVAKSTVLEYIRCKISWLLQALTTMLQNEMKDQ